MRTTNPHGGKEMVETAPGDTISEEEINRLLADNPDEINALLYEAREQAGRARLPRLLVH